MSDELSHSIVQEDSEEFLSLEEGENVPIPEVPPQQNGNSPTIQTTNEIEGEVIDMEVLGEYSGNHTISWPIQDMDCPHCASEACLLYTSPSPRDRQKSRMPSSA